ncbi:glycosyltransferase family 4 protein [Acaryochloris sp. IP29b_bin.137]|uniref:glycosyltransferase family 4 protein n=1 Tax=Acaryochloris sp. IP29b_bin.137 TaxID=2969217 RepID=UPI002612895C|nr:glycosyltransferase family 4 protein [Acaryochloris sp. IP29b_bin.137]
MAQILCVGKGWFPNELGGLNRYVYELTRHLSLQDQVQLAAVGLSDTPGQNFLKFINLSTVDRSLVSRLAETWFNSRQCCTLDLNAVNLHFSLYSLPMLGHLPQDVPWTFTFHGPWASESLAEGDKALGVRAKQWFERYVYDRCDRFIVLSQAFGNILHQDYRISRDKIHVIPGGVDTQRFSLTLSREDARSQLGWPQDRFILFSPRRLVNRMGLDRLIDAIATLKTTNPDIWVAIAGKGPLRDTLAAQISDLGLADHIKLLGYLPDEQLPMAYQATDLTVIPSQALEGFGLIILESLASGTPVMTTPIGGMPEILQPFTPELITHEPSAAAIAEKLSDVLTGQISMPSREECYDYAFDHFNWPKIAAQVRRTLLTASR